MSRPCCRPRGASSTSCSVTTSGCSARSCGTSTSIRRAAPRCPFHRLSVTIRRDFTEGKDRSAAAQDELDQLAADERNQAHAEYPKKIVRQKRRGLEDRAQRRDVHGDRLQDEAGDDRAPQRAVREHADLEERAALRAAVEGVEERPDAQDGE